MDKRVLMRGNDAIAEAAIRSGCRYYFGYPITPQNELTAYMAKRMPEVGGTFIQAESEIAAINMVYGAASAGQRAMTSSSGPGISLKQEGISYLAGAELPCFYASVVRGGPGLGNIAPAQSDYFQATRGGGHGDYRVIVLAPNSVQEMADLTMLGFHLADKYRNPAMVLADAILGQMLEPMEFKTPHSSPLPPKDWAVGNMEARPPRLITSLFLGEGKLEKHNLELKEKYEKIQAEEVRWDGFMLDDTQVALVAYGTCARIARGAVIQGRAQGVKIGLCRPITLWPFPSEFVGQLSKDVRNILVVEMSLGQMVEDVRLAVNGRCEIQFYGRTGGGIPTVEEILKRVNRL